MLNQLKLIFKLRKEGPEARTALLVSEENHQMTTRAKSRGDFQVEMVTAEQQRPFQHSVIKACYSLPVYMKEVGAITQFKKTLRLFSIKNRDNALPLIT